jgi:hypothetical protein
MAPLFDVIKANPTQLVMLNATFSRFASFDLWHNSIDNAESGDRTGAWESLGSRLLPMALCEDDGLRVNASIALAQVRRPLARMQLLPVASSCNIALTHP